MKKQTIFFLLLILISYATSYIYTYYNYNAVKREIGTNDEIPVYKLSMILIYRIIFTNIALLFYIPYTIVCYIPVFIQSTFIVLKEEIIDFFSIFKYILNMTIIRWVVDYIRFVLEFISDIILLPIIRFIVRSILYIFLAVVIALPCVFGIFVWGKKSKDLNKDQN